MKKNTRSLSLLEAGLTVAVVALVGFVSYTAFTNIDTATVVESSVTGTASVSVPNKISNKTDLLKVENALDAVDTDSTTELNDLSTQLESL